MEDRITKLIEKESLFGIVIDYKHDKITTVEASYLLANGVAKLMALAYQCGKEGLEMDK